MTCPNCDNSFAPVCPECKGIEITLWALGRCVCMSCSWSGPQSELGNKRISVLSDDQLDLYSSDEEETLP